MENIIENIELMNIATIIFGIISIIIALAIFNRKKHADRSLAELFKSDKDFINIYNDKIEKIKIENEHMINMYKNNININSHYELKSFEIKTKMLEQEIELLKLELLKEKINQLILKLSQNDKHEILQALNQKNIIGQKNYINNILKQSGSTENISYELER